MGILNYFRLLYKTYRNPVQYYRSLGMQIGENCEIYPTASFGSEPYLISLGNHVRITDDVRIITHDGGVWVLRELYPELEQADKFGAVTIGDNVHIGTGVTIMPGVKIGNNCIIGCGAIVTHNIPDNSVAVGIPAKVIESIEEYKEKNSLCYENTKGLSPNEKRKLIERKYNV